MVRCIILALTIFCFSLSFVPCVFAQELDKDAVALAHFIKENSTRKWFQYYTSNIFTGEKTDTGSYTYVIDKFQVDGVEYFIEYFDASLTKEGHWGQYDDKCGPGDQLMINGDGKEKGEHVFFYVTDRGMDGFVKHNYHDHVIGLWSPYRLRNIGSRFRNTTKKEREAINEFYGKLTRKLLKHLQEEKARKEKAAKVEKKG